MPKTILSEDLLKPLAKIKWILKDLTPVQQQQILELMMVTHLFHFASERASQRHVMEGFTKHVWQLLDQAGPADAE